jgi:molecular chaperone GrpE
MVAQPTSEVPPDTVIMVVQRGWLLHGRLVRPARVIVARAP